MENENPNELLAKLLPESVVERAYKEILSPSAKELGEIAGEVVKTAHLILAPLQVVGAFQERFQRMLKRIAERVPAERLQAAPPEVVGPALHHMQYLPEGSPLWSMFEELLSCSVDVDGGTRIHPSFAHLIGQLSPDEARILYHLRDRDFSMVDIADFDRGLRKFRNFRFEQSDIPEAELSQPKQLALYYSHLHSLILVEWPVHRQEPICDERKAQVGIRRFSTMRLTEFGRLFVAACVPTTGFEQFYTEGNGKPGATDNPDDAQRLREDH